MAASMFKQKPFPCPNVTLNRSRPLALDSHSMNGESAIALAGELGITRGRSAGGPAGERPGWDPRGVSAGQAAGFWVNERGCLASLQAIGWQLRGWGREGDGESFCAEAGKAPN